MDMKVSHLKPVGLSSPDCISDPEEKEVSDEDDDDRNHKHRRRGARSQSLERDSVETVYTRSYRKRNKPFENGHSYRDNIAQGGENWRNYQMAPIEKEFTSKFDRRRPGLASVSRANFDFNPRIRPNQIFSGESVLGRGRGRDSWNQRDSRFGAVDIASQLVPQGPIAPNLFRGRGLPNVSNAQSASWNAFGLIPGIPNGGLDPLHSIGLQGTLRPTLNSSLNMGIPRQRCRDFEERGFCLRGDMCSMEHGVNRIVVEDVQSLSQFNLPGSISSAQLVGTHAGPGSLQSIGAPSTTLINSRVHGKSTKVGMVDDGLGLNGAFSGSGGLGGGDFYDPDQPLWNNNGPEASGALLAIHSPKNEETESLMSLDPSDRHHERLRDDGENEGLDGSSGMAVGSQSTSQSVWGRIGSSKNRLDVKDKIDLAATSSDYMENQNREDQDGVTIVQGTRHQGKRVITDNAGLRTVDSSARTQNDTMRTMRKPSQKALRTLFVNGIPLKSNRREALFSHFQKFGEIVDIYIPLNSERAFVQFSKREEAEAALKAPDAVMGNRFIKLWWANRDSVPDDGTSNNSSAFVTSRGVTGASVPPQPSASIRAKDTLHSTASKANFVTPHTSLPSTDQPKPNGPKVTPVLHKKLELEQLKEELRKKQELLAQKRDDFKRQLDKLGKQATGVKGETESSAKRQKVGVAHDAAKATTPRTPDPAVTIPTTCVDMINDKNRSADTVVSSGPKTNAARSLQESSDSKQPIRPLGPAGTPFLMNRYKLDNRPTTFKIIPPLPVGLASVAALKEYFSSFGDVFSVEIEDIEHCADNDHDELESLKHCSATVTFTTRRSAERAFVNGKCWQGNSLQFVWVTSGSSGNGTGAKENSTSAPKCFADTDALQPAEKSASMDSQEASASGVSEPENMRKNSGVDNLELHEVSEPCSTSMSSGKESTKHKRSLTLISGEEESPKCEPGPTAMSGETESQKGDLSC